MTDATSQKPNESIPASELWLALADLPRPSRVVDFPRIDPITGKHVGQLAIWVLTQEEQIAAAAEADKVAKRLLKEHVADKSLGYEAVYENEATVQVLFRACRDPKDINNPAFPSAKLLRTKLTVDEVSVLATLYFQVQRDLGPIISTMSEEEERAWIGRLAEGGKAFPTATLSRRQLEALTISMASQLVALQTATSSAGSPLEQASAETELPEGLGDVEADAISDES